MTPPLPYVLPAHTAIPTATATPVGTPAVVHATPVASAANTDSYLPQVQQTRASILQSIAQHQAKMATASTGVNARRLSNLSFITCLACFVGQFFFPPLSIVVLPACIASIVTGCVASSQANSYNALNNYYTVLLERLAQADSVMLQASHPGIATRVSPSNPQAVAGQI